MDSSPESQYYNAIIQTGDILLTAGHLFFVRPPGDRLQITQQRNHFVNKIVPEELKLLQGCSSVSQRREVGNFQEKMSYEAEQQRLQRLLEECLSDKNDNNYDDSEEEGEEDNVEEGEEGTDTEQEFEDVETQLDSHREYGHALIFIGKDGTTIWRKHPLRKMIRRSAKNIVSQTQVPGVKGPTHGVKDPLEI
ncbi:hypothetical protein NQ318_014465 [Aromia moschata]|uniref:Uncharacterized protein n=1 Tax=Aromia moschata TaxID=1265417 RepID=A0AAV8YKW6_9CUCU|nr:hypothetical protein NQ318_014465 [Aromia moschata]